MDTSHIGGEREHQRSRSRSTVNVAIAAPLARVPLPLSCKHRLAQSANDRCFTVGIRNSQCRCRIGRNRQVRIARSGSREYQQVTSVLGVIDRRRWQCHNRHIVHRSDTNGSVLNNAVSANGICQSNRQDAGRRRWVSEVLENPINPIAAWIRAILVVKERTKGVVPDPPVKVAIATPLARSAVPTTV